MRRRSAGPRETNYKQLVTVGLVPFLVGLFLILAFVRRPHIAATVPDRALQDQPASFTNCSQLPQTAPPCNCSQQDQQNQQLTALAQTLPQETVDTVLGAANSTDPAEQTVRVHAEPLPSLFLFVGILSGRGYRHRRLAVRESWANLASHEGDAACRFILSQDEVTPQVQKEVETHNDIILLKEKTNYKSILFKTYFVLEYAITHYDVRYILKTDDDAFVNHRALIQQLRWLCSTPGCRTERVYMGKMAKESEVLLQPGHKWNNMVFYNHTGLKTYPNYMMGGGYVVSGDVAASLVNINKHMRLKFTPIEDATLGFWLMSMDLRHIDHPRFYTWAAPCCFKAPVRREGQRIVTRFQLQEDMDSNLCSEDPWLVLHKVDSPTKMRYIGQRLNECNASSYDPSRVAPSIQPFVIPQESSDVKVLSGAERRKEGEQQPQQLQQPQ